MYIVNLYKIRWNKKYTQEEICSVTGLSKKVVSQLFSGKYYNYKLSTLETIAKFLIAAFMTSSFKLRMNNFFVVYIAI